MMSVNFRQAWAIWFNYMATITLSMMSLNVLIDIIAQILPFMYDLSRYIEYAGMI